MSKKCEQTADECRCPHYDVAIRVVKATVNCETTVTECLDCGAWLDQPKTECL